MHVIFQSIVKENKSALPKETILHHEGKLENARFPYSTRTSALPKTIVHHEGNIMHARFPSIIGAKECP